MSNKEKKYNEEIVTENENTCETKKELLTHQVMLELIFDQSRRPSRRF